MLKGSPFNVSKSSIFFSYRIKHAKIGKWEVNSDKLVFTEVMNAFYLSRRTLQTVITLLKLTKDRGGYHKET